MAKNFMPIVAIFVLVALLLSAFPSQLVEASPDPDWWNSSYGYRKKITVTNPSGSTASAGYPVYITIDHASLVAAGKSLANGNDVRIVFWTGSTWVEKDRKNETAWNTSNTKIWFDLHASIGPYSSDDNYYLYYGYSGAGPPLQTSAEVP